MIVLNHMTKSLNRWRTMAVNKQKQPNKLKIGKLIHFNLIVTLFP